MSKADTASEPRERPADLGRLRADWQAVHGELGGVIDAMLSQIFATASRRAVEVLTRLEREGAEIIGDLEARRTAAQVEMADLTARLEHLEQRVGLAEEERRRVQEAAERAGTEIVAAARAEAEAIVREAEARAAARLSEAEQQASRRLAEASARAEQIVEDARARAIGPTVEPAGPTPAPAVAADLTETRAVEDQLRGLAERIGRLLETTSEVTTAAAPSAAPRAAGPTPVAPFHAPAETPPGPADEPGPAGRAAEEVAPDSAEETAGPLVGSPAGVVAGEPRASDDRAAAVGAHALPDAEDAAWASADGAAARLAGAPATGHADREAGVRVTGTVDHMDAAEHADRAADRDADRQAVAHLSAGEAADAPAVVPTRPVDAPPGDDAPAAVDAPAVDAPRPAAPEAERFDAVWSEPAALDRRGDDRPADEDSPARAPATHGTGGGLPVGQPGNGMAGLDAAPARAEEAAAAGHDRLPLGRAEDDASPVQTLVFQAVPNFQAALGLERALKGMPGVHEVRVADFDERQLTFQVTHELGAGLARGILGLRSHDLDLVESGRDRAEFVFRA